jgi:hypothetical protein
VKKVLQILLLLTLKTAYTQVSFSGCYISGALINPGSVAGCGSSGSNYCNIASLYVPAFTPTACGNFTTAAAGTAALANYTFITGYTLPAGCTASVTAEFKKRGYLGIATGNGCDNAGMDGSPDAVYITQSGGVVASQGSTINVNVGTCGAYPSLGTYTTGTSSIVPGCSNADGAVGMVLTGGSFTVGGASNRADEFITFTVNLSGTCGTSCSLVLPIELTDFFGVPGQGYIQLNWKVATENSTKYYTIEKSIDGNNWISLGQVFTNPAYNRNLIYNLIDDYPVNGINYYRLKDTDEDGTTGNHSIIAVNYHSATGNFQVDQSDEYVIVTCNPALFNAVICVTDLEGKQIKKVKPDQNNSIVFSKKDLSKGLYMLSCENYPLTGKTRLLVY